MPSESATLDQVFRCLSNSTRREVIAQLTARPASMTELAARFDMSLPSFLQHLQVLEEAGLVRSQKSGRVRTFALNPPPILMAENWLDRQRQQWTARLDQLDQVLKDLREAQSDA